MHNNIRCTALALVALSLLAAASGAPLNVTGEYTLLGQAPIAAAHAIQLPCGSDQFLLMGEKPPCRASGCGAAP